MQLFKLKEHHKVTRPKLKRLISGTYCVRFFSILLAIFCITSHSTAKSFYSAVEADWHQICGKGEKSHIYKNILASRSPLELENKTALSENLALSRANLRVELKKATALQAMRVESYLLPFLSLGSDKNTMSANLSSRSGCEYLERQAPIFWKDIQEKQNEYAEVKKALANSGNQLMHGFGSTEHSYMTYLVKQALETALIERLQPSAVKQTLARVKTGWAYDFWPENGQIKGKLLPKQMPEIYPANPSSGQMSTPKIRAKIILDNNPILSRPVRKSYGGISKTVLQWVKEEVAVSLNQVDLSELTKAWVAEGVVSAHKHLTAPMPPMEMHDFIKQSHLSLAGIDTPSNVDSPTEWNKLLPELRKYILAQQIFYRDFLSGLLMQKSVEILKANPSLSDKISQEIGKVARKWHDELSQATGLICENKDLAMESDSHAMGLYLSQQPPGKKLYRELDAYCNGGWGINETSSKSMVNVAAYSALAVSVFTPLPDEFVLIPLLSYTNLFKGAGGLAYGASSAWEAARTKKNSPLHTALYGITAQDQTSYSRKQAVEAVSTIAIPAATWWTTNAMAAKDVTYKAGGKIATGKVSLASWFDTPVHHLFGKPFAADKVLGAGFKAGTEHTIRMGGYRHWMVFSPWMFTPRQLSMWGIPLSITLGNSALSFIRKGVNPLTEVGFLSDAAATMLMYGVSINLLYSSSSAGFKVTLFEKAKNAVQAVAVFLATDNLIQSSRLIQGNLPNQRVQDFIVNWCPTGMYANQVALTVIDKIIENSVGNPTLGLLISLGRVPLQTWAYTSVSYRTYANMYFDRDASYVDSLAKTYRQLKDGEEDTIQENRYETRAEQNLPLSKLEGKLGNTEESQPKACATLASREERVACSVQLGKLSQAASQKITFQMQEHRDDLSVLNNFYRHESERTLQMGDLFDALP